MINGLIQAFGGEIVFIAWHFLWSLWAICSYIFVCWVSDSKILIRIWNWIKHLCAHIMMSVALSVVTYKSKNKKHGKK
jgi:hypothetical protein